MLARVGVARTDAEAALAARLERHEVDAVAALVVRRLDEQRAVERAARGKLDRGEVRDLGAGHRRAVGANHAPGQLTAPAAFGVGHDRAGDDGEHLLPFEVEHARDVEAAIDEGSDRVAQADIHDALAELRLRIDDAVRVDEIGAGDHRNGRVADRIRAEHLGGLGIDVLVEKQRDRAAVEVHIRIGVLHDGEQLGRTVDDDGLRRRRDGAATLAQIDGRRDVGLDAQDKALARGDRKR